MLPSPMNPPEKTAGVAEVPDLDAEVLALTSHELRRTLAFLLRARFVAAAVLAFVGLLWFIGEPPGWQPTFMGVAAVSIGVVAWRDHRRLNAALFGPREHAWLLATVLLTQTAIIVPTGGIASPAVVLYVPVATLSGVGLGRHHYTALLVAFGISMVWLFAVLAATGLGPEPGPASLGITAEAAPAHPFVWIQAGVLTIGMGVGAAFGMLHRQALDRAVRSAAVARTEALGAIAARNREFLELSNTLAHELKNPLASIQGLAGLMVRTLPEGERSAEQAGVLLREARRMGGIVDELSSFARPAQGLAVRRVAPAALAADVLALHEGLAAQREIDLRLETGATGEVVADPRKLTQVLVNLIQNALDAVPARGRVVLRVAPRESGGVTFTIDDDGPGLAPEMRERLFVPGATTKAAGNGLGLRIARAIAQQHGGTLTIGDAPGGGCRAMFDLPTTPPGDAPP